MQITTFASSSSGNCTLIRSAGANVLIDAGISMRSIKTKLSELGLHPEELSAVLITHEHTDHIRGLQTMVKQYRLPILAPRTVANHLRWSVPGIDGVLSELEPCCPLELADLRVTAFRTTHDTPQSVGYRIDGDVSFGFCTDLGHVTDEVFRMLEGVEAAVLEANHDEDMLLSGPYPFHLKKRILSERGHLSNRACGELAAGLAPRGLRTLILGHLSKENNLPRLALETVQRHLKASDAGQSVQVLVAPPAESMTVCLERNDPCSV